MLIDLQLINICITGDDGEINEEEVKEDVELKEDVEEDVELEDDVRDDSEEISDDSEPDRISKSKIKDYSNSYYKLNHPTVFCHTLYDPPRRRRGSPCIVGTIKGVTIVKRPWGSQRDTNCISVLFS